MKCGAVLPPQGRPLTDGPLPTLTNPHLTNQHPSKGSGSLSKRSTSFTVTSTTPQKYKTRSLTEQLRAPHQLRPSTSFLRASLPPIRAQLALTPPFPSQLALPTLLPAHQPCPSSKPLPSNLKRPSLTGPPSNLHAPRREFGRTSTLAPLRMSPCSLMHLQARADLSSPPPALPSPFSRPSPSRLSSAMSMIARRRSASLRWTRSGSPKRRRTRPISRSTRRRRPCPSPCLQT